MEMNIDFVARADQEEIIDYFTGKIDYTDCINAEKKSQLFKKQSTKEDSRRNENEDELEPGVMKKSKL